VVATKKDFRNRHVAPNARPGVMRAVEERITLLIVLRK
jgi:hypothetical protein